MEMSIFLSLGQNNFAEIKITSIFAVPKRENYCWCGSSAWLEYRPVTPGVAGSSPVRTAKELQVVILNIAAL